MFCYRKVNEDLYQIGGNDRRLSMFEGVYSVPNGISYNSYLLIDKVTVLFDTVDRSVSELFFENLREILGAKPLDYLIVHHMEPDHSATIDELLRYYPGVTIICNAQIQKMANQFFDFGERVKFQIVKEGDSIDFGKHKLSFIMAPMVHWPEVMMSYDETDKILFSADAFGCFGATDGALFADEVDFFRDYLDEARRYYTNIVGKYGDQVQAVLRKAKNLEIGMICPLHGFVWRRDTVKLLEKYQLWSTYTPEENGVLIAYASVYQHTQNAAEILATKLRCLGVTVKVYDVSVTPASNIISDCFKFSHLVFASTTYNTGIFVKMEEFLSDLVSHNIRDRKVSLIQNGSWAPTSANLMKNMLSKCSGITFLGNEITIKSALKREQLSELDKLAEIIKDSIHKV